MSATGRVLVTGASGFVGRHCVEVLLASGRPVRGLFRTPPGPEAAADLEAARVHGLHDREGLRRALAGVEAVVHLAARVHVLEETAADPLAAFRAVNVEGTRTLLEESAAAGVRSFVFVSSVKAVGEASGSTTWTEATEPRPVDPYGVSKREAEILVRAFADEHGVHAPILRLPLVYGPGVGANMLALLRAVARGVPLPLGAVRNRRSLAYVGNVAAAVAAVLDTPESGTETFFVSDGEDLSTPELVRRVARALDRPARLVPVPPALFRAAGAAGDLLRRAVPVPVHSAVVDRLLGSLAVDSSRLARVTGRTPPFSVDEGLARTAAWYRAGPR